MKSVDRPSSRRADREHNVHLGFIKSGPMTHAGPFAWPPGSKLLENKAQLAQWWHRGRRGFGTF